MKKLISLFVAFLLLFNLLSPYAALAESNTSFEPKEIEEPIEIQDDTYELEHVNACLSDLLNRDEINKDDLADFHLDQLELTEEEVLTLKDCLSLLLLEEEEAANEEMATEEEAVEEAVVEEETTEDAVTEEAVEEVVAEDEATEDAVPEEEAVEEVVAEEGAAEEAVTEEVAEEVVTEEETVEEAVTEEESTEEVVAEEEAEEEELVLEELEESPMIMFSTRVMEEPVKKSTSRLGHLYRSATVYKDLDQSSTLKLSDLLDTVYYIKQQATYQGETFYLISKEPSATKGTVGWVKSSDIRSYTHTTTHKNKSTYYVNGSGKAYTKASGGSKDEVYSNLSNQKGQEFHVHLTEKAGNDTWFRGTLNNKTVWIKSSDVSEKAVTGKKTSTSRLGHLYRSATVYKDLGSSSKLNLSNLLDTVYYIKQQATYNGDTYYLISTQPSATKGTVGWVKSSDIRSYAHSTTNKNKTTLYVKGTGKAYTKAWGGSKDEAYSDLTSHKGKKLEVNLTEKVGNDTWYRGKLDNRTVFIKSSDLNDNKVTDKKSTSRLGHLYRSATVYKDLGNSSTLKLSNLLDTVYYIKQQAQYNGNTYYLISKNPSTTKGTVGWVKSSDIRSHAHTTTDKKKHTFYVNGTGKSYTKAWGGSKDLVFNLSSHKNKEFVTNLTEKVGNDTWYRGTLSGKTAWIHANDLSEKLDTNSNYNITLDQAANMQVGANAQTDRYTQYVHKDFVTRSGNNYVVNASALNVRSGPGTNYPVVGQLKNGQRLSIRSTSGSWYRLFWVDATKKDIVYYLDPKNFINDPIQQFQFLDLAKTSGASETSLNNYLRGKGILAGQGKAFIDAGRIHGINDVYLLSHALLETGNGSSTLAKGVKYNGVTVYNMYGIGALDSCPIDCGTKYAYDQGWTTPYKSIVGGAAFIGNSYVKSGQNSLYKMRWNPDAMVRNGRATHQYATDIGWASKQVHSMYNLYQGIGSYTLNLDVPVYK
ncbi:N-acetylglucosaminidase [Alkalihalobacillus sp. NPDC078783]